MAGGYGSLFAFWLGGYGFLAGDEDGNVAACIHVSDATEIDIEQSDEATVDLEVAEVGSESFRGAGLFNLLGLLCQPSPLLANAGDALSAEQNVVLTISDEAC